MSFRLGRIHWSAKNAPTELAVETTHPAWAGSPKWSSQYVRGESPAYGGRSGEQFIRRFILSTQQPVAAWTTGADALQVARIVDAAYLSSQTGRRVEIEPALLKE